MLLETGAYRKPPRGRFPEKAVLSEGRREMNLDAVAKREAPSQRAQDRTSVDICVETGSSNLFRLRVPIVLPLRCLRRTFNYINPNYAEQI